MRLSIRSQRHRFRQQCSRVSIGWCGCFNYCSVRNDVFLDYDSWSDEYFDIDIHQHVDLDNDFDRWRNFKYFVDGDSRDYFDDCNWNNNGSSDKHLAANFDEHVDVNYDEYVDDAFDTDYDHCRWNWKHCYFDEHIDYAFDTNYNHCWWNWKHCQWIN